MTNYRVQIIWNNVGGYFMDPIMFFLFNSPMKVMTAVVKSSKVWLKRIFAPPVVPLDDGWKLFYKANR